MAAAFVLVLALAAAYANSLSGPFVYDDLPSIEENLSIRQLADMRAVLSPPSGGLTVSGRPVLNLSFALNYAIGGLDVRGYHVANLAIHALATLLLFGLLWRTLTLPTLRERWGDAAVPLAFFCAALWGLHPLQTESVTYVVQRAESLMGLFYLATLYGFARSAQSSTPARWRALSVGACLLGMATKENMASAPLLVLLYDRTLVAGTFAAAWRRNRGYYLALGGTWLLLGALIVGNGGARGGTVGFTTGLSWFGYWLTQGPALVRYLALSVWPSPLIFERGPIAIAQPLAVLPHLALVLALAAGAAFGLWKKSPVALGGALFFAVLAPTSLLPGGLQAIVEHRMYLPLAAVVVLAVCGGYRLGGRATLAGLAAAAVTLGAVTHRRNNDYRTELALWQDTVAKSPNAVAEDNLGGSLQRLGRPAEAIPHHEAALRRQPDDVHALSMLGHALTAAGRPREALPLFERALAIAPDFPDAHLSLGLALDVLDRTAEALPHYETAARLDRMPATAYNNLGDALRRLGRADEAIAPLEEALRLRPNDHEARANLASALAVLGRFAEAEARIRESLRLKPDDVRTHVAWGNCLLAAHRTEEAVAVFETALRLAPAHADAHYNYGAALAALGRFEEARAHFAEAARLKPERPEAHNNLGNTLLMLGRPAEAVPCYEAALRLKPNHPSAHNNLGLALARLGRLPEAVGHFAAAVELAPDYADAQENLARARAALR